jgi:hypothetical protein
MIRTPSAQKPWDVFVTCDSAITPAPDDKDSAEYKAWQVKIKSALETGNWSEVVVEGQDPTKFTLGHVDRNIWRAVMDRAQLPVSSALRIGEIAMSALLFRLAIQSISGFATFKRVPDRNWDGWVMAPASIITDLDSVDPSIVGEISGIVFRRLAGIDPLS